MAELEPAALRRRCDPAQFAFDTTAEVEPLDEVIGQPRALAAIEFGLGIEGPGYNIFATGPAGTGKRSTLEAYLKDYAARRPAPGDWVQLFNFDDPQKPLAVGLGSARAHELQAELGRFIAEVGRQIPRAFESESYQQRRRRITDELERQREEVFAEMREFARGRDLDLELTPAGVVTVPIVQGRPVKPEEYERLPEEAKQAYRERGKEVEARMSEVMVRMREVERAARERLRDLDREVALFAVGHLVDDIKAGFDGLDAVLGWLDDVREDIIENLQQFQPGADGSQLPAPLAAALARSREEFAARYEVNVLVSNAGDGGAPVVVERNPTYYSLFGAIEYQASFGAVTTDHRNIRPGAIHRANGGYLVLQALDVFTRPFLWDKLKDALGTGQAKIENMGAQYTLFPTTTLTPEPIPLDLKVILVGPPAVHQILYALDEDVRRLFKVKADFDVDMPWGEQEPERYAAFISRQVRERGLRHFDREAVARVVEQGARLVEHQGRLSTSFIEVENLAAEASHWAGSDGSEVVGAAHVERAIAEKVHRSNLIEQRVQDLIDEGTLMVDTEGACTGQVNGLAVGTVGDYAFGHPVRITATVSVGKGDVVSIDREIELSGPIHDKGFLILTGYLADRYGRERVLTLQTSLVFEQSYEGIEGDSASSAELFALLSHLADAPVDQGLAVTGSINQRGEIQPIGGVNEKVEGFFKVCRRRGLNGRQGVIVPAQNARHLMLRSEVVEAVAAGDFHVHAVATVDEGLEILTGERSGERGPDGAYPEGTLHRRIEDRLAQLAEVVKEFQPPGGGGNGAASP